MEKQSPFLVMQRVEVQIKVLLRSADTDLLAPAERKALVGLRRLAVDARLDIRDYELSETRKEQLKCAVTAKKQLAKLEKAMLVAGSVFAPVDVAQLSAQLGQIESLLL